MFESFIAKANFVGSGFEIPYTVLIGVGSVFAGLICIVIMCKIVGLFCGTKKPTDDTVKSTATPVANAKPQVIENHQEIIAAVSAVIAEELGTDVSALRILSFKKL